MDRSIAGARRGRAFVRSCGTPTGDWRHGRAPRSRGHAYLLVGVAEIGERDLWRREAVHDLTTLGAIAPRLSFEGRPSRLEPVTASCPFGHALAHETRFRRVDDVHGALGWGSGGLVLRDTRAPSTPGTTLCLLGIVLNLPEPSLPDASMVDLAILPGEHADAPASATMAPIGPCPIPTRGMTIDQVLTSPIWGWGDEPRGFASTMRLDVVDRCTRLQDLLLIQEDADPEEIERLRRSTEGAVQTSDPMFQRHRAAMHARGLVRPWDDAPTASDLAARRAAADEVVRDLMARAA